MFDLLQFSQMFLNFRVTESHHFVISKDFVTVAMVVIAIIAVYFFSYQIQQNLAKIMNKLSKKIGTFSVSKEYALQKYAYQHSRSPITKLYVWVNEQLIALGLKRQGITVTGYLLFWGFSAVVLGTIIGVIAKFGFAMTGVFWIVCFACMLIMTRVLVSERMEKREADVMNAVDLIVPEVGNGVKNAIVAYKDNFAPSLREDFLAFITNIQDRGYSFNDAMFILADNLGIVFQDFAQKAIYYEAIGEKEMVDIFSDITETNRLRRQLRDENNAAFTELKASFIVSTFITCLYFGFIMVTDAFSRHFFLQETFGKVLLVIMILIVFLVLAYISTIKSKNI